MKRIWKLIIVVPIVLGIIVAVGITLKNQTDKLNEKNKIENLFGKLSSKPIEITRFYTYGTSLNVEGTIDGISKDNFEGLKLVIRDGENYEKTCNLDYDFEEGKVVFSTREINNSINLEDLQAGKKYYLQLRVKTNNSKDFKYYTFKNSSEYKNIEYYSLTKDGKNNKVDVKFEKQNYNGKDYNYLGLTVKETKFPKEVYDIVIDCGHGGTDKGNTSGEYNERDLTLDYGKALKTALEEKGYKVKLSRDDSNTENMTELKAYDEDGRITICCKTKAKYMLSLHNTDDYSGVEVYVPNNVNLDFANKIATNLYNMTSLELSTNKSDYKVKEGIYQKNFNKDSITTNNKTMTDKGLEPYNLTYDTPRIYTIREVGGIATNAYMDGRNILYSPNKYYKSNQGIESYQVCIGNIKSDLDVLLNEKEQIVKALADAF